MTNADRDRDASGRPNNNRPRDSLGRPLPYDAIGADPVSGADPAAGADPVAVTSPAEAVALAQRLLEARRPFQAHEVLEEAWKRSEPQERQFWQALAQSAVAVTHAARGNLEGAATLLRRSAQGLSSFLDRDMHSVPSAQLREWALQQSQQLSDRPRGEAIWLEPPSLTVS